jgi:hypothetical protein
MSRRPRTTPRCAASCRPRSSRSCAERAVGPHRLAARPGLQSRSAVPHATI